MIVTATEAGSVWTNHPFPPPLVLCKQYALSMRIAMLKLEGHSKPDTKIKSPIDYHQGATKAYKAQVAWMESKHRMVLLLENILLVLVVSIILV